MGIIAIPSYENGGLNANFHRRFGRCDSFTFVTVEKEEVTEVKAVPNSAAGEQGGVGVKAAQLVGNYKANNVIIGIVGPNATESLNELKINIYQAPDRELKVKEVVDLFIQGKLSKITSSNIEAGAALKK